MYYYDFLKLYTLSYKYILILKTCWIRRVFNLFHAVVKSVRQPRKAREPPAFSRTVKNIHDAINFYSSYSVKPVIRLVELFRTRLTGPNIIG